MTEPLPAIHAQILRALKVHPAVAWAGHYDAKGLPNILGQLIDGRMLAIEVLGASARRSGMMDEFIFRVKDNGGCAFVARSVAEVWTVLDNEIKR